MTNHATARPSLSPFRAPVLSFPVLLAAASLAAPSAIHAQNSEVTVVASIDSIARRTLATGPVAGMSIGVVRGQDTIVLKGYGFADIENDVPATPQTVYRIGSLTKQFTALAVLQLVEQGRIGLDDDITTYLPDFATQRHRVTVRHLLTHTSGIKSYTSLGEEWLSRIRLDLTQKEVVALFEDEPFEFDPGEQYAYSNSGYFLLGMIIEKVSGQTYADYLRGHVVEPLGLDGTYYCDNRTIIRHRAEGYGQAGRDLVNDDPVSMTQPYAAGGLCSSLVDLLTWQRALLSHRLISADSYRLMITSATLSNGTRTNYGFGLGITQIDGRRTIGHGGGINGFNSYMAYLPDDSLQVVVLANTEGSNPWDVARDVIRVILGTLPPPVAARPLTKEERDRYTGFYDLGDLQLHVFVRDGRLMAQATGQPGFQLMHQGKHRFVADFDHTVRITFEVRGNLAVGLELEQSGRTVRAVRIPER